MKSKIFLFGIIALMLSACGEELLNVPSKTSLTSEIFFKTEADFTAALNATYAPLRDVYNGATAIWALTEMQSDNARYILNPDLRASLNQENLADFIKDPANTVPLNIYVVSYRLIARANQILATIDDASFTEASKTNIKGQALYLRAFAYSNLVQIFGSIPMHLTPSKSMDEAALKLSTSSEVLTQIITDATAAKALLPEIQAEVGRVTKGAANMLLANTYMLMKDYAKSETLLKEIVTSGKYKLMADYASVFSPANKNNSESIFEVQYKQGSDGYSSAFCYTFFPYPLSSATVLKLTGVTNPNTLNGNPYNVPSPELIAAYEAGDKRLDVTVGYETTNRAVPSTYPFCKKYLHPHTLLNNSDDNWPVYRYAETLLYLAEAINEQNRPAEALTYINTAINGSPVSIRGRAGLAPVVASSQADVRTAIRQERRIELAFENKRWPDLVRYGTAIETITAYGARIKANPSIYYYPTGTTPPAAAFTKIDLVWPLPADESLYSPYF